MVDKDTIIKGCENWIKYHKGEELTLEFTAIEELLTVLKEQEVIEPRRKNISPNEIDWFCGKCGHCIRRLDNYCSRCGRKVKWND